MFDYRLGDTQLPKEDVYHELASTVRELRDGLHQIVFVTRGKFTAEEIGAFNFIQNVLFDGDALKFTTIVRNDYPDFANAKKCKVWLIWCIMKSCRIRFHLN